MTCCGRAWYEPGNTMKKLLAALLVLAVIGAAMWAGVARRTAPSASAIDTAPQDRYDFEAQGVVLRQLDTRGKLQYEIEAERIVQLADGDVEATKLTFRHDPPVASRTTPQRWVVTAEAGSFPATGSKIHLTGQVRTEGTRTGSSTPLVILSEGLDYDTEEEVVCADGDVEGTGQGIYFRSQGACVNIATGMLNVESGNGKISL